MTIKNYNCWTCEYFNPLDPTRFKDGRCHRHAPHALDFFGFPESGSSVLVDKGDILTNNGADDVALPVGTDGQVLTANSAAPDGIEWDDAYESPLTSKGDVFSRDATGDARLPVGANGQVITADSAEPLGVKWADVPATPTPLTTKGDLLGYDTGDARVPVGSDGQCLQADSAEPLGVKWADCGAASPLTTKGDIYTRTGSGDARLPVGTDGQILVADAAEVTGQKWENNPGNSFVVQYQVGRLNEQLQNNLFNLARNGIAPASGTNFPTADGYTIFDNGDIHPFAIPDNGEIIALQFCFSRVAVGVGSVGANPYLRVYIVENGGSSETVRATVDLPIPPAYVDINNNLGSNDYYCAMLKLTTPTTFSGTPLWGLRIDLSDNTSTEQVSSVRNFELIAYARIPISDVLDSSLPAMAMAMAVTPESKVIEVKEEVPEKTTDLKSGSVVALTVSAPLPGTDAESTEKWAYIPDGETFWCGEYKRTSGAILPLP